jgi:hypothetical protein
MGLLDDAIKEHLDLKRRRGADPAEVDRQAAEALGPVRRSGDPVLGSSAAPAAEPPAPAPEHHPEPRGEEPAAVSAFHPPPPSPAPAAPPPPAPEAARAAEPEPAPAPRAEDPAPAQGEPPRFADPHQRTAEFSAGDVADATGRPPAEVVPAEDDEADDDVLDQTPEFLSETPEHDRLWFEQKPPKDFDF